MKKVANLILATLLNINYLFSLFFLSLCQPLKGEVTSLSLFTSMVDSPLYGVFLSIQWASPFMLGENSKMSFKSSSFFSLSKAGEGLDSEILMVEYFDNEPDEYPFIYSKKSVSFETSSVLLHENRKTAVKAIKHANNFLFISVVNVFVEK